MNVNTINKFTQGNFASWTLEGNFPKITKIQGEIPTELNGVLYRNGPNPQFPDDSKHWFEGDGMLHAFTISNGNVSYSNRWIYTERFLHERKIGKVVFKVLVIQRFKNLVLLKYLIIPLILISFFMLENYWLFKKARLLSKLAL